MFLTTGIFRAGRGNF